MKALKIVALCLLGSSTLSTFGTAQAAGLPSAEEVRKVMDYYYNGVDGAPVLVDFKLCQNIHREGVEKNNCQDEIHPDTLTVGENVYAWMNFMVPKNESGEILMQLKHGGVTRGIRKANVQGAIRYRTWRKIKLSRAGDWELPILYEGKDGIQEVDTVNITVHEPVFSQLTEQ